MLRGPRHSNSILAVDFGSVHTRVILIDIVDGQYRLITRTRVRTTLQPPINDVRFGLGWAMGNLEKSTQRQLIGDGRGIILPEENGQGVDEVVMTSSAARPLNAVLLGLMSDISISSARRALTGTYVNVAATLSIADGGDEEARINKILQARPDLIFISGGTDGGNTSAVLELVRLADTAVKLVPEADEKPIILYAGNNDLAEQVEHYLSDAGTQVQIAANIRPALLDEDLETARLQLAKAYGIHVSRQQGGFAEAADWNRQIGIVPTAQSVTNMVRWLGEDSRSNLLHLDVGSTTSTLIMSLKGDVKANIHSDLGIGHSILSTIQRLDLERLMTWLPFELTEHELLDYAYNKTLTPSTIPQSSQDLFIEQALAREIGRLMLAEARAGLTKRAIEGLTILSSIICAGAILTETPHPGISAMLLLDILEPEGVVALYADPANVVSALGAIAYTNAIAAVQVFDNQGLNYLGTAFCTPGRARQGRRPAMRIQITLENGRTFHKDLLPGEIWTAPLPPGQKVVVDIRLGRGLRINSRRRIKQQVQTGTAGIIFDLRGRPLPFVPFKRRAEIFAEWWKSVTNAQLGTNEIPSTEAESVTKSDYRARQNDLRALQLLIQKANRRAESEAEEGGPRTRRQRRRGKERRPEAVAVFQMEPEDQKRQKRRGRKQTELEEPDWEELLKL